MYEIPQGIFFWQKIMMAGESRLNWIVAQYPPEFHERLLKDLRELLLCDRQYTVSQVQSLLSQLRIDIDQTLLEKMFND